MMLRSFLPLLFLTLLCTCVRAQGEIDWTLNLNTEQIRATDKRIFNSLEKDIIEFLNGQLWTDDRFEVEERVEVTLFLTVAEVFEKSQKGEGVQVAVPNLYTATLAIQSLRPVYNTAEKTPVLNTLDQNIVFTYRQGEGVQYSEQSYLSDLGSILAFYSYIILGMDYDTFSPLGGDPLFDKAQALYNRLPANVSGGQTAGKRNGWSSGGKTRNRYYLLENLTNPRMLPLRRAYYNYHRLGLDMITTDLIAARNNITLAIEDAQKANQSDPQTVYVQAFVDAKREEIIGIYKGATAVEQNTVIQAMSRIDPSKASNYRNIRYRPAAGRRPAGNVNSRVPAARRRSR